MTQPKFTPGPWTIPPPSIGFSQITGADGELVFGLAAGAMTERRPEDVCRANAHLIAAAPELYGALAELLRHCERQFVGWPSSLGEVDARNRTVAALAKARGIE